MTDAAVAKVNAEWWARAANLVKALAATSGIVTFLAFGWQIYKEVRNARTEFVQVWQESEIFGVVFECRDRGATMPTIENELKRRLALADAPYGIQPASVTGPSVRRALMQLTEREIIGLRPDFTYAVPLDWAGAEVDRARSSYGCHCYKAGPEDADIIPPDCAKLFPVAQGAAPKSGT